MKLCKITQKIRNVFMKAKLGVALLLALRTPNPRKGLDRTTTTYSV